MTRLSRMMFATVLVVSVRPSAFGQQAADPNFDTKVNGPAYTDRHPAVLFDEAHHNMHTVDGRYKPFATLIKSDGYSVTAGQKKFSKEALKGYDVLIIANAQGAEAGRSPAAADSAFAAAECDAVRAWIESGGALLLITDIHPWGAAAAELASRLGVESGKSTTFDPVNVDTAAQRGLAFSRGNGLLGDHPILRGRNRSEQINRVLTFSGQSLKGPSDSVAILKFSDTATDEAPDGSGGRTGSAAGRAQGLAFTLGKGRVVVLGEAAMLSAQLTARNGGRMGMNTPGCDNRQLALNIMHWLSALKDLGAYGPVANSSTRPQAPAPAPTRKAGSGATKKAAVASSTPAQSPAPAPPPSGPSEPGRTLTTAQIAAQSEKSIALISGERSSGTGFLVRPGLLMTNAHVIDGETMANVRVRFPSAETAEQGPLPADLVYQDSLRDLALLKVKTALPPLRIAPSYTFVKGDDIIVIGNPGAGGRVVLENAISRGVMSTQLTMKGLRFYQLGISVNPGNSGGPVFDSTGAVIGVVTRKTAVREALAFCIPVEDLHPAIEKAAAVPQDALAQLSAQHDLILIAKDLGAAGALYSDVITRRNEFASRPRPLLKFAPRAKGGNSSRSYSFKSGVIDRFESEALPKLKAEVNRIGKDRSVAQAIRDTMAQLVANLDKFKAPMALPPPEEGENDLLPEVKNTHRRLLTELYNALSAEPPPDIMRALEAAPASGK
jgi:S1-C subfamily serine protease